MPKISCPNPVVHLIGEIAVAFGILELFLELSIWQLIAGKDEALQKLGEAITAEMSFDRKVHALYSMFALKFPEEAADPDLRVIVSELFVIQDKRNRILHSAWSYSQEFGVFTRMKASAKAKRGLTRKMSTVEPEELIAIHREISELANRFGHFTKTRIQDRLAPRENAG